MSLEERLIIVFAIPNRNVNAAATVQGKYSCNSYKPSLEGPTNNSIAEAIIISAAIHCLLGLIANVNGDSLGIKR